MALLGHVGLVAVHAVNVVLVGSEAFSHQSLAAGAAHETLGVPGLVLVADPPRSDGLRRRPGEIMVSNTTGLEARVTLNCLYCSFILYG